MYDEPILKAIDKTYKTAREISNETSIPINRVSVRLRSLKKSDLVESIVSLQGTRRHEVLKFRKIKHI